MCGLGNVLQMKPDALPDAILRQRGVAMAAMLRHRGPDGWGCWTERGLMLAHTRPAIIDTTTAADRPMHTGTVHVVFNGAIYNFRELRTDLLNAGYRFRSRGDTEVIVNG
jgi:asparagine synthase (glutamine-hydrolysing)